ncbi:cupin domain-containing protein [Streptomyces sp. NBC_00347]|uniref:cupin domain-containing protein n=1 Tax=Streptomyces sp. NBC_00347 TaxID=2975721 RepID=UPI00225547A8|nr:cupin domain-containing protein [Streptomyces sp. NBC_00347]MCX5126732.1 cupin domain-containing protein [Streptomyces sp. NBC_00347]
MNDQLPGGVGISLLRVYGGKPAADGLVGGSPHMHLACSEGYYVVSGRGMVQTLNSRGSTNTRLEPGVVVWFDPGTIHRLVNEEDLTILVIMSNSGLPEAGDAVLTFPQAYLADRPAYAVAAKLTGTGETALASAMRRRDLAIEGFTALRGAYAIDGPAALDQFYASAVDLVRPRIPEWRQRWRDGAQSASDATAGYLEALEQGSGEHLPAAVVHALAEPTDRRRPGMCGLLDVYVQDAPPRS